MARSSDQYSARAGLADTEEEANASSKASAHRGFSLRSEEHTSELQSPCNLVCRLLLEKKKATESASRFSNELSRSSPVIMPQPSISPKRHLFPSNSRTRRPWVPTRAASSTQRSRVTSR